MSGDSDEVTENQSGARRKAWWSSNERLVIPDGSLGALKSMAQAVSHETAEPLNNPAAELNDDSSETRLEDPALQLPSTESGIEAQ